MRSSIARSSCERVSYMRMASIASWRREFWRFEQLMKGMFSVQESEIGSDGQGCGGCSGHIIPMASEKLEAG